MQLLNHWMVQLGYTSCLGHLELGSQTRSAGSPVPGGRVPLVNMSSTSSFLGYLVAIPLRSSPTICCDILLRGYSTIIRHFRVWLGKLGMYHMASVFRMLFDVEV